MAAKNNANTSPRRPVRSATFGSRVTSVISVALTLAVLGILAMTAMAGHRLTDNVRRNLVVTVQAGPGANDVALNRIKRLVAKNPATESYSFLSADMVLSQEVQHIGEELTSLLDENPFSAEFEVRLRPKAANAAGIAAFARAMKKDAAVADVITDVTVVNSVNTTMHKITVILAVIGGILLVISLVLINATISLSIYSKRFLIRTMKLVGATPGFIRRPFVRAGFVNGLFAGLLASALLAAGQTYAIEAGTWLAPVLSWTDAAMVYAGLILLGLIICPLAAWGAATRYLRRNYDSLYRK